MLLFQCPECQNKFTMSNNQFNPSNYSISCPSCKYNFDSSTLEHLQYFLQSQDSSGVYLLPDDTELIIKPKL